MASLSGSDFALYTVNDAALSPTQAEYIIGKARELLILYGEDVSIPPMQGTVGAKTLTVSDKQKAAIELAARPIYASYYKNAANQQATTTGQISHSNADLMSNPTILTAIKEAARLLRERDWSRSII